MVQREDASQRQAKNEVRRDAIWPSGGPRVGGEEGKSAVVAEELGSW